MPVLLCVMPVVLQVYMYGSVGMYLLQAWIDPSGGVSHQINVLEKFSNRLPFLTLTTFGWKHSFSCKHLLQR